jgi:hypothetical protein
MDNDYGEQNDALVVGNTDPTRPARVQLYLTPTGQKVERPHGPPVTIEPGETHTFTLAGRGSR